MKQKRRKEVWRPYVTQRISCRCKYPDGKKRHGVVVGGSMWVGSVTVRWFDSIEIESCPLYLLNPT